MIFLKQTLAAWRHDNFAQIFKQEMQQLDFNQLPLQQALQQALQQGSHVLTDEISVMLNQRLERDGQYVIHAGVFFNSIVAGCNCADDPTPVDKLSEYAEFEITIEKPEGEAHIKLL